MICSQFQEETFSLARRTAFLVDTMGWSFVRVMLLGDSPVPSSLLVKSSELQTIKTELTQIKSNIDALLGRLEQIAEEQKANPGQPLREEHGKDSVLWESGVVGVP
jgi:hypothetical protein